MKPRVFISKPIPQEVEDYISENCEYRIWNQEQPISTEELYAEIKEADGLLTSGGVIGDELFDQAPKLKIVSNTSVGYNNFDLDAMQARGIMGTHTPSVLDDTVADLVFSLILATARRVPELDRYVKEGKWTNANDRPLFGVDVHHTTLGIIGMGRIGEQIAKRASLGFDMEVLYYNRSRKIQVEEKVGAQYVDLSELLTNSDFIVLMTPLTPKTTHLIGAAEFKQMKQSAIFINASRGQVVDEQALIDALRKGEIAGAGLDVYDTEPVSTQNPLLSFDNVVTLPHIGSATEQTRSAMAMLAAQNLVAGLQGKEPPNLVPELRRG
ncbi:2-hydroxyacid dehydrogenase [Bacillus horti]|uniref:Gluconate 2-dehydrogenase n=1 Tax=Caldalkalibacillus horti TaxID=77523 RepID=A0ABT9W1A5_9BACI|nr:D-glycerate dehydrogenase [Bacillus horti]MDQ0167046.1 gluconate 2-dehydrogenase [Bacillus horti]